MLIERPLSGQLSAISQSSTILLWSISGRTKINVHDKRIPKQTIPNNCYQNHMNLYCQTEKTIDLGIAWKRNRKSILCIEASWRSKGRESDQNEVYSQEEKERRKKVDSLGTLTCIKGSLAKRSKSVFLFMVLFRMNENAI